MKKIICILLCIFCINVYADSEVVTLNACVDGDTVWFNYNGEKSKFRFLAMDTPESVHPTKEIEAYGKEASDYTCELLTNAKEIIVQFDADSDIQDKYDRYLAWIWVDGELLQEKLVEKGYAQVAYIYGDYFYTNSLCKVQQSAKNAELGIWSIAKTEEGYCSSIDYTNAKDIEFTETVTNKNNEQVNEKSLLDILESKYPYLTLVLLIIVYFIKKRK